MTPRAIIAEIVSWITLAVSVGLLLLILAAVAGKFGIRVPMLPPVDPTPLAWLCGAFWLWRGGKP